MQKAEVTFSETVGQELQELAWFEANFAPAAVRFVKLTCRGQGWIMLSEVQAYAGGTNVAPEGSYRLIPQPTPTAQYPDSGGELTDGDYPVARHEWGKAIGWSEGTPGITVDLMRPELVGRVRVHLQGGGAAGVWFPQNVRVSTSLDGQAWSESVQVAPNRAEAGDEATAAFLEAVLEPRQARLVRVDIERRGWAMVDEIEVYGP